MGPLTEKVVANAPSLVKANQEELPGLKERLRALQADATKVASDCLEPMLLHRTMADEELLEFAHLRSGGKQDIYVSLPGPLDHRANDPMRRLAGAIGSALSDAGLLRDGDCVDAQGRYRSITPEHPAVTKALDAYESALKDFIRSLYAHARLVGQRASNEASQLWRDA